MNAYCKRLCIQIPKEDNVILIGVSFGGMVAMEIASIIGARQTIIISSLKSKSELPKFYVLIKTLKLYLVFSFGILKHIDFIANWMFSATNNSEKLILKNSCPSLVISIKHAFILVG